MWNNVCAIHYIPRMCISLSQLTTSWLAFSTSGASVPPSCSPIIIYRRIAANIHILRLITKAIFWMLLRVALRNRSWCKQVRVNRSCILITCALSINLLLCTANKSVIAFTARRTHKLQDVIIYFMKFAPIAQRRQRKPERVNLHWSCWAEAIWRWMECTCYCENSKHKKNETILMNTFFSFTSGERTYH